MADMIFAFTVEKPECEAAIVYSDGYSCDITWPITTEAEAYKHAKRMGVPGFWRIKCKHNWIETTHLNSTERQYTCSACNRERQGVGQSL